MTDNKVQKIDVQELKRLMDQNPNLLLIDVREQNEWDSMHIPNAVLIPKESIADKISEVCDNKSQAIYLHCRSGVRSLHAAESLLALGYHEVYSVDGGIMDWAMYGYEIVE